MLNLHTLNLTPPPAPRPTLTARVLRALAYPFGLPLGECPEHDGELFLLRGRPGYRAGVEADHIVADLAEPDPFINTPARGKRGPL